MVRAMRRHSAAYCRYVSASFIVHSSVTSFINSEGNKSVRRMIFVRNLEPLARSFVDHLKLGVTTNMASAEELRSYASRCLALAQRADNPGDKARLLQMAEAWKALADKAAAKELEGDSDK
jgi:hypothetical protein